MGSLRALRTEAKETQLVKLGRMRVMPDEILGISYTEDGMIEVKVLSAGEYPTEDVKQIGIHIRGDDSQVENNLIVVTDRNDAEIPILFSL